MYKDQNGNVTIGIGHLIASADMAAALPFTITQHYSHGDTQETESAVSTSEKKSEFNQYKSNSKAVSGMHLSNDAVIGQCISDVKITETGLGDRISHVDRTLCCARSSVGRWINWFTFSGAKGLKSLPA